jgi:hypothetical protein
MLRLTLEFSETQNYKMTKKTLKLYINKIHFPNNLDGETRVKKGAILVFCVFIIFIMSIKAAL